MDDCSGASGLLAAAYHMFSSPFPPDSRERCFVKQRCVIISFQLHQDFLLNLMAVVPHLQQEETVASSVVTSQCVGDHRSNNARQHQQEQHQQALTSET